MTGIVGNVLIVDGDQGSLRQVSAEIHHHFPRVDTSLAASVEQAVNMAEDQEYDLFIIDLGIRGFSGVKLMSILKGMNGYADTPFIFMSGIAELKNKLEREYPDIDYFDKPEGITGGAFMERIERLLTLFKTLTQLQTAVKDMSMVSNQLEESGNVRAVAS